VRGGGENRPYNKIVGPFRPCGFGLRQVVNRLADPPQGIERACGADWQAAVAELNTGRGESERDIEAIVHEKTAGRPDGQTAGEFELL
jgi:hypothetical protein